MLSRFHLIPERNGRTDGRTDRQADRQISYKNERTTFWHKWSMGQGHETVNFGHAIEVEDTCVSQTGFLTFLPTAENFYAKFTRLLYAHIYAK